MSSDQGTDGEARVRTILDCLPNDYDVFHDVRVPDSAAVLDHLVVGPRGVYAVDTEQYAHAVTFGIGSGTDEIWTGGYPIDLGSCSSTAAEVGRRIGVAVRPTMCIIAPVLPEPSFEFGGVQICHPNRVLAQVTKPFARKVDVAKVSARVTTEFGAEPAHRPDAALAGLPVREPQRLSQRPWFRLVVVAVIALVGFGLFRVLGPVTDRIGDLVDDVFSDDEGATDLAATTSPTDRSLDDEGLDFGDLDQLFTP